MTQSRSRHAILLLSSAALALVSVQASAQEAPAAGAEASGVGLGDIIVTARKRAETSIAVPVVVTAFSGADLQARSITSLDVVARLTPGLIIGEGGATAQGGNLGIRGIQGADTNLLGDQAVSFNLDGVQIAKATVRRIAQMDIEQVEVLKGPQALFFGKNSPGGIISVRTADPTRELSAKISGGYEFQAREAKIEGYVSGPLTDTLGARLAFYGSDMGGWIKSQIPATAALQPTTRRGPDLKEYAGRFTLKYEPSDAFNARFKLTYNRLTGTPSIYNAQFIDCPTGGTPFARGGVPLVDDCKANDTNTLADIPDVYNTISPFFATKNHQKQTQLLGGLELNYNPNDDITVTSVTGFYKSNYNATFMSSATYEFASLLPNNQYLRNREITQELRVTSSYDGPLNFTFGGFFQDVKGHAGNASGQVIQSVPGGAFDTAAAFSGASFFYRQETKAYSAFGQMRWNIFDALELAAGGRYSKETKRLPGADAVLVGLPPVVPAVVQTRKVGFDDFSPEISLTYRPTNELTVFGSYKRGFLSGGFNTGSANTATGLTYDQETVKGFEAGIKALLLDGSLRTNLSAFTYEAKGIQLSVTTRNGVVELRNAGSARIKGLEWDVNYRTPLDGLYLRGGIAYTHGRYTDYIASCYQGQSRELGCIRDLALNALTQNLAGSQVLRAPDWQGNAGFTFDTPISSGLKFGLTGDMSFSSGYFTDAPNDPRGRMPSYQLFNATIRVAEEDDRWEIALIGRNLGNKYYWVRSADRAFTAANTGGSGVDPNPALRARLADKLATISRGREVMLRATFKY
jgi:iron complex outermembrane receptor protein